MFIPLVKDFNRYTKLSKRNFVFFISEDFVRKLGTLGWLDWSSLEPFIGEFRKRAVAIKIKPAY